MRELEQQHVKTVLVGHFQRKELQHVQFAALVPTAVMYRAVAVNATWGRLAGQQQLFVQRVTRQKALSLPTGEAAFVISVGRGQGQTK